MVRKWIGHRPSAIGHRPASKPWRIARPAAQPSAPHPLPLAPHPLPLAPHPLPLAPSCYWLPRAPVPETDIPRSVWPRGLPPRSSTWRGTLGRLDEGAAALCRNTPEWSRDRARAPARPRIAAATGRGSPSRRAARRARPLSTAAARSRRTPVPLPARKTTRALPSGHAPAERRSRTDSSTAARDRSFHPAKSTRFRRAASPTVRLFAHHHQES